MLLPIAWRVYLAGGLGGVGLVAALRLHSSVALERARAPANRQAAPRGLRKAMVPTMVAGSLVGVVLAWNALHTLRCPESQTIFVVEDSESAYQVPAHCSVVSVHAWGGGGGGAMYPGGGGGFAAGQLRVRTDDVLTILVGGRGSSWAVGGAPRLTGGAYGGQAGFAGRHRADSAL